MKTAQSSSPGLIAISVSDRPVMWHRKGTPLHSSVTSYPGGRISTPVTLPASWLRADELTNCSPARMTSDARIPTRNLLPISKSLRGTSNRSRGCPGGGSSLMAHTMVPSCGYRSSTRMGSTFSTPTSRATLPWPGCPSILKGSPRSRVLPSSMTCTVSPRASASSRSWVTRITGMLVWASIALISPRMARRSSASNEEKGSSNSSAAGLVARALANATRCCCPPESSQVRRPSIPSSCNAPTSDSTLARCSGAAWRLNP